MDSKNQIYARFQKSKNLPSLPQVLLQLIETCDKDDMHLSELSQIIMKDASLCSKVLRLVNSAYFGLNNRYTNLNQAVVYLGADTIKNISVMASVQQIFSGVKKNASLSMDRFWWNSISSAIYAKRIARQVAYTNIEEAYLAGLLRDLGELLLWMNFSKECTVVQSITAADKAVQCKVEEKEIGINHCEAGAWLIKEWKLSSFIADTVLYHHASLEKIKCAFPLVKIVYLAEKYCQIDEGQLESIYDTGDELFDLRTDQIDEIHTGVEEEIQEVAKSFGIKIKPPVGKKDKQVSEPTEYDIDLIRQVENYSLLHVFLENLVQAENRDAIFKAIEQALNVIFDVETIFFFLHDFEQQKMYGNASTLNRYIDELQSLVLSAEPGTSLLVKAMLERQSITCLHDDSMPLDSLADAQLLDAMGGKGMLYLPMIAKKRPVGVIVIGLSGSLEDEFTSKTGRNLLQLLVNHASMSLYWDGVKKKQAEKIQAARLAAASMAAAKIVHEVNNPLSIIKNYLKILGMKFPEDDSQINGFTILDEEITRISTIIQQLDNFSTPVKRSYEKTDLNILLTNLLAILSKSTFYSSHVQVHFMQNPDLPAIVTDGEAIKQIIINLIQNAAEAMVGGGNVYVKANRSHTDVNDECIELTIKDDGPGIPEKILSQLFEPFTSTKGKGHSGLGLSIVSSLVTEMKGTVNCTSDEGGGTLFTIILPVKQGYKS